MEESDEAGTCSGHCDKSTKVDGETVSCVPAADQSLEDQFWDDDDDKTRGRRHKKKKSSGNLTRSKPAAEEEKEILCEKKPPMKTSRNVISRILWDPELKAGENFTVGYKDRFLGLIEKPFQVFCWDDFATVDPDVLAIPRHCIVYFKYRGTKVWDKKVRMDLVFGSGDVPADCNFHELMQRLDEEHSETANNPDECEEDSDSDDSYVHVETPAAWTPDSYHFEVGLRPNYFVAVRITNPDVVAKASEVKEAICSKDPRLRELLMPNELLHITLAVLCLDDPSEVTKATRVIANCRKSLAEYFQDPMTVDLQGLATFHARVLYVRVNAPPRFYEFHEKLLKLLTDAGVLLAGRYKFVPHVTILKLTKSRAGILGNPYVDSYTYVECKDCDLGSQICDNLNLCIINESKRCDGFYQCETELNVKDF